MSATRSSPAWRLWGAEPFAVAEDTGRPVLLAIGTKWSRGSVAMRDSTYGDDAVRELIDTGFVPIAVDADDRPDVAERYGLGGWPTVAFLTPDGRMLGGQRFTERDEMVALLERVTDAFARRRDELMATTSVDRPDTSARRPPVASADLDMAIRPWLRSHLVEAYDPDHGGFGRAAKRIQEAALLVALGRDVSAGTASGVPTTETLRDIANHTLTSAHGSALCDDDSGLFRYAARRDWTEPSREKLLTVNATALRVFVEGLSALGERAYRERASGIIHYVRETLVDHKTLCFSASQTPDGGDIDRPGIDATCYTGANAEMTRSFVWAATTLGDSSLLSFAVNVLDGVVADAYEQGEGILRRTGAGRPVRGLLVDQVTVSEALLDAYEATEREVYRDLAQELMLYARRELWHRERGVFVDRVVTDQDLGLLRRTMVPFALNCRAAGVLSRLARASDDSNLHTTAVAVLAAQAPRARSHSIEAAWYVLALGELGAS